MTVESIKTGGFATELQRIIDFWAKTVVDTSIPGFHGQIENDGTISAEVDKGAILCSRILWFLSEAAIRTGDSAAIKAADHIYGYATDHFKDTVNGGYVWSVKPDGSVSSGRKQTFAQTFFIYALCAYYRLKNDQAILDEATALWQLLEEKTATDGVGGHLAAFEMDWTPLEKMGLDDIHAPYTFDTELHVLEAYAALYRVNPSTELEQQIRLCLSVFDNYFIERDTWTLHSHIDASGNPLSKVVLYGYSVESAWLIWDAVESLNDQSLSDYWKPPVVTLIQHALAVGLDENGRLLEGYVRATGEVKRESVWWVQAEALVAMLLVEELSPEASNLEAFATLWEYIKAQHIDTVHGEWLASSRDELANGASGSLVNQWKGPYHNGRAMLKVLQHFTTTT